MPAEDFLRVRAALRLLHQIADDDFPEDGEATLIRNMAREVVKS